MRGSFQLFVNGAPADPALAEQLASLEVEENAEMPGAIRLSLPVRVTDDGDLSGVTTAAFGPFANLAVVVTAGERRECIFDGFVLSQKLHLERGTTNSHLDVWGQDASWLMNLEERAREWADVTDGVVANSIFGEYGFQPAPKNTSDDSPAHTSANHTLMQRGTDIQFLTTLARRTGKLCRVACGAQPGLRVGHFARPDLDAEPVVSLRLDGADGPNTGALDFEWDVTGATEVSARQVLFDDDGADGVGVDVRDAGLSSLAQQDLPTFAGKTTKVLLTTAVDGADELEQRARSLLREAGFFVRCAGEADLSRLGTVLRVGAIVDVVGVGALFSGKYLVWSVRHALGPESHRMSFTLVRNAVGAAGRGDLLGGLA